MIYDLCIKTIIGNGGSTGGGGTSDHALLTNRNIANQHIIGAISQFSLAAFNSQLLGGNVDFDTGLRDPNIHNISGAAHSFPGGSTYLDANGNFTTPAGASPLTTKGDIWAYDTADNRFTIAGIPDGYVLTKDAVSSFGFKWAAGGGGGGPTTPGTTVIGDIPAWGDTGGASLINAIPLRAGFAAAVGQTYYYTDGARDTVMNPSGGVFDAGFALIQASITNTDISFSGNTITFGSDNPLIKYGVRFSINVVTTSGVNDGNYTVASMTSSTVVVTGSLTTETAGAAGTVTVRMNPRTKITVAEDGYYSIGYNIFGTGINATGTMISTFTNVLRKNGVNVGPTTTVMTLDSNSAATAGGSKSIGVWKENLVTTDELSLNIVGSIGDSTMQVSIGANLTYFYAMRLL